MILLDGVCMGHKYTNTHTDTHTNTGKLQFIDKTNKEADRTKSETYSTS